jgi:hypothetical protein
MLQSNRPTKLSLAILAAAVARWVDTTGLLKMSLVAGIRLSNQSSAHPTPGAQVEATSQYIRARQ